MISSMLLSIADEDGLRLTESLRGHLCRCLLFIAWQMSWWTGWYSIATVREYFVQVLSFDNSAAIVPVW